MSGIGYESGNPQSFRDSSSKKEPREKTPEELLREWQERLGLQDWRIFLRAAVKKEDMEIQGVDGCVDWTESIRTARIDILAEEDYGDKYILHFDFEETLVHELLHLKFSLLDDSRFESASWMPDRYVHQLIDDLARALVCAKRGILRIEIKPKEAET
jgi:hypothetical protein